MTAQTANIPSRTAAVLNDDGVSMQKVKDAVGNFFEVLAKRRSRDDTAYGMCIYEDTQRRKLDPLTAHTAFVGAYLTALDSLRHHRVEGLWGAGKTGFHISSDKERHVRFFVGTPSPAELKSVQPSPGFYILLSDLDAQMLKRVGLPPVPASVKDMPLVVQVEHSSETPWIESTADALRSWLDTFAKKRAAAVPVEAISRDTRQWREALMVEYPSWSSTELAEQRASTAKNRASVAHRWLNEKKIFSVKHGASQRFPQFQFKDGEPLPVIAQVIQVFPESASGWDLAYFFTTPNASIGDRKPLELLRTDSDRIVSLARAFAAPADVF